MKRPFLLKAIFNSKTSNTHAVIREGFNML